MRKTETFEHRFSATDLKGAQARFKIEVLRQREFTLEADPVSEPSEVCPEGLIVFENGHTTPMHNAGFKVQQSRHTT